MPRIIYNNVAEGTESSHHRKTFSSLQKWDKTSRRSKVYIVHRTKTEIEIVEQN
jgi:hypothetical protein